MIVGAIIYFLVESVCLYTCFRDAGPRRTYVLSEIWFLICGLLVREKLISRLVLKEKELQWFDVVVGVFVCVLQVNFIRQVPMTMDYCRKSEERNRIMRAMTESDFVKIPELPPSHLLISYFANDVIWLKNVYLPYWGMTNGNVEVVSSICKQHQYD